MKTNRKAAVLALGLALLSPLAGAALVDTEWWKVDFTSPTPEGMNELGAVVGDVELFDGDSVSVLTNTVVSTVGDVTYKPAYASGFWRMADGDESVITNSVVTNALEDTSEESLHIKLDTQGNDLVWAPSNGVPDVVNLVDADLLLVGSDSAPDHEDFDPTNATKRVQTAIFLKNATDEESGETTNSVLCVYSRNTNTGKNEWMELTGDVKIEDNSWHHVQVSIDYTGDSPMVVVKVDGQTMSPASGGEITAANPTESKAAAKVQEVCFRGTGAVDNFVGTVQTEIPDFFDFTAEVYMDGKLVPADSSAANKTIVLADQEVKTNSKFSYEDFKFDNWVSANEPATWCLEKVDVVDVVTSNVTTYTYSYAGSGNIRITADEPTDNPVSFPTRKVGAITRQTGSFTLEVPTEGATGDMVVAKIYFKTIGAFNAFAETTIDGTTTTNAYFLKPENMPVTTNWTFAASEGDYHLASIQKFNGASISYDAVTGVATVSVSIEDGDFDADTKFATATYAAGALAEGQELRYTESGDTWTFTPYTPPVAIRVSADGTTTNECSSLRQAIEEYAQDGDTVYLVADDRVSFSATATEIGITKTLTIDGGSNTLYGVTDYAYDGHNDHDIYIGGSGNVTIKNLTLSEFSDMAPTVQYRTYPIWTGQKYAGTLVLDGVTVTNYARTAVNLSGGSFLITNCVFAGYADAASPTRYYQDAVVVFNATGTVANTTVTGVGDANTGYGASVFTVNSSGAGEITVKSGSYTGAYIAAVNSNATGRITIEGGTFVATNTNGEDEKPDTAFEPANTVGKIVITDGWFNLEPEAKFLAAGLSARKLKDDSDPAPWTVGQVFEITFWTGDELDGAPAYWATNAFTGETGYGPTNDPTKAASDGATYAFAGWTNELAGGAAVATADLPAVDGAASWLAAWTETAKSFDVVFMNGETQFATTNVAYGTTEYAPTGTPAKAATAQFTYAFAGWSDTAGGEALASLPAVTNDATFYAAFTATTNEYTITWTMDDDSVIDTTTVAYGTVPTHADPTKAETAQYAYTFNGWDPEPVAVTGEATYKATFLPVLRSYDVTFWTGDEPIGGEAFWATNVLFGATGYGPTNDPVKAATSVTNFAFAGWTNAVAGGETVATADLPAVGGDASWLAVWTETPIWKVTFKNGDDTIYETNYLDGATAEYVGATPTKDSTAQYAYTFAGWDPALGAVTADTVYAATFSSNAVEYAIAYDLDGGQWPAGYTPTNSYTFESSAIVLPTPVKDGYAFDGWTNALGEAATGVAAGSTGDQSFGAKWTAAALDPVDPGQSMTPDEKLAKPPVAVVADPVTGDVAFTVHFRGEEGVTYQLVASESCAITEEQWKGEAASGNAVPVGDAKTTANADQDGIIELAVPMSGSNVPDVRFFKIKATR